MVYLDFNLVLLSFIYVNLFNKLPLSTIQKINKKLTLESIRHKISTIDQEIVDLLIKRFNLVHEIASFKKQHSLTSYDPKREEDIYKKIVCQLQDEQVLSKDSLCAIYKTILTESVNLQNVLAKQDPVDK